MRHSFWSHTHLRAFSWLSHHGHFSFSRISWHHGRTHLSHTVFYQGFLLFENQFIYLLILFIRQIELFCHFFRNPFSRLFRIRYFLKWSFPFFLLRKRRLHVWEFFLCHDGNRTEEETRNENCFDSLVHHIV